MNVYEIASRYEQAFLQLAEMDDLPLEVIDDTLEGIEGEFNAKALAVAAYIENLHSEENAIEEAIEKMRIRSLKIGRKAEYLKAYLLSNMQKIGVKKISSPEIELVIKKNPPKVVIDNQENVPPEYIKPTVIMNVDKKAIAEAVKQGATVAGAHIEQSYRLSIA